MKTQHTFISHTLLATSLILGIILFQVIDTHTGKKQELSSLYTTQEQKEEIYHAMQLEKKVIDQLDATKKEELMEFFGTDRDSDTLIRFFDALAQKHSLTVGPLHISYNENSTKIQSLHAQTTLTFSPEVTSLSEIFETIEAQKRFMSITQFSVSGDEENTTVQINLQTFYTNSHNESL
jgi:hypothetical protein